MITKRSLIVTLKSSLLRGPGYWKCNVNVLEDEHFHDDFLRLWDRLVVEKTNYNPIDWWDFSKLAIRRLIITHATRLACNRRSKLGDLNREINKLKTRRQSDDNNPDTLVGQLEAEKNAL